MKPNPRWLEYWQVGENPAREIQVADDLLRIFNEFWTYKSLDEKSKTTRKIYADALHALGGYLVEKSVFDEDDLLKRAGDLLTAYVGPDGGPLIHFDHEKWQNEYDMVCRKLYRFINQ